jgi:hypothetical protein
MKEVRRIKFTGKNLNDVFALPCVKKIVKIANEPQLIIYYFMLADKSKTEVVRIGDELVEYEDGRWEIVHPEKQ